MTEWQGVYWKKMREQPEANNLIIKMNNQQHLTVQVAND